MRFDLQLLEKDPAKRLGTPGCLAGEICDQPFFKTIDWDRLDRKEIEPPFRPKVVLYITTSIMYLCCFFFRLDKLRLILIPLISNDSNFENVSNISENISPFKTYT